MAWCAIAVPPAAAFRQATARRAGLAARPCPLRFLRPARGGHDALSPGRARRVAVAGARRSARRALRSKASPRSRHGRCRPRHEACAPKARATGWPLRATRLPRPAPVGVRKEQTAWCGDRGRHGSRCCHRDARMLLRSRQCDTTTNPLASCRMSPVFWERAVLRRSRISGVACGDRYSLTACSVPVCAGHAGVVWLAVAHPPMRTVSSCRHMREASCRIWEMGVRNCAHCCLFQCGGTGASRRQAEWCAEYRDKLRPLSRRERGLGEGAGGVGLFAPPAPSSGCRHLLSHGDYLRVAGGRRIPIWGTEIPGEFYGFYTPHPRFATPFLYPPSDNTHRCKRRYFLRHGRSLSTVLLRALRRHDRLPADLRPAGPTPLTAAVSAAPPDAP